MVTTHSRAVECVTLTSFLNPDIPLAARLQTRCTEDASPCFVVLRCSLVCKPHLGGCKSDYMEVYVMVEVSMLLQQSQFLAMTRVHIQRIDSDHRAMLI